MYGLCRDDYQIDIPEYRWRDEIVDSRFIICIHAGAAIVSVVQQLVRALILASIGEKRRVLAN